MPSAIDPTKPVQGNPTTESVRDNFVAAKNEIEVLQLTAGVGPQGPPGNTGPAGSVDIGTTTTGIAGSNATVTAAGTPQARILNFTVPRGDTGAGGGGITESQAVDAVRQGQVRFEETPITSAPSFPTAPNIATTAPVLGAGWVLAGGADPILGPWEHTSGTGTLAFPIVVNAGDLYQILFTTTYTARNYPIQCNVFFRNGPTVTTNQQQIAWQVGESRTFIVRAESAYTHMVIAPITSWVGSFTLTRIVRAVTQNSSVFSLKDQLVTVRPGGDIFIGGGGKAYSLTDPMYTCNALGKGALQGATTGNYNVGVGRNAVASNSSGQVCIGIGSFALASTSNVNHNIGIGHFAGAGVVTGGSNVIVGGNAMSNCDGDLRDSTAIGYAVLNYGVGSFNTGIGSNALVGSNAVGKQHGPNNTALGANAGRYLGATTVHGGASNSIFIGYNSRSNVDNQNNQIVIGAEVMGHGSNTVTIGNTSITHIHSNVSNFSVISDSRVKENVQPANIDQCLEAVKKLPVSRWKWKQGGHANPQETGFMAEDVEKVFPQAVTKQDEWLTVYGSDGKPEMTTVSELVEPSVEGEQQHVEQRVVEKTEEYKGLCRVALTEGLPTLWGAVQRLIQKVEELSK